jgi:digeranylgeranylglycerophospholipid reductase
MTAEQADVVVVGGGPAGLIAARESADAGLDVVLLERDQAIGTPVRCGEGVGSRGVSEFISPESAAWVSRRITRVIFWAPDGTEVRVAEGDVGYILDRSRFEPALAAEAVSRGADVRVGTEAIGLERRGDRWRVVVRDPRGHASLDARIVVAADGVETMVARWAGLDTRVPARDMESCAQYVVSNIAFDPDAIYLHFGRRVAPGGYAWIFPKDVGTANVGLGVVALRADGRSARAWLDDYLARYFPGNLTTGFTVGGVIVHPTIKRTVTDGLIACGDAAHMVNPLSGGGIVNAMKAGRLAAQTVVRALAKGDTSAACLQSYHDEWMRLLGEDHLRYYRLKEAIAKFDDAFLNDLARTVNEVSLERRTLGRIFASALVHHPSLLPVAARFFV